MRCPLRPWNNVWLSTILYFSAGGCRICPHSRHEGQTECGDGTGWHTNTGIKKLCSKQFCILKINYRGTQGLWFRKIIGQWSTFGCLSIYLSILSIYLSSMRSCLAASRTWRTSTCGCPGRRLSSPHSCKKTRMRCRLIDITVLDPLSVIDILVLDP